MAILPLNLVRNRLEKWIGHGKLDSDFWIVGMEEGGRTTYEEQLIRMRLPAVSDNYDFHEELNRKTDISVKWFRKSNPRLQETWRMSLRILVCATNICGYKTATSEHDNKSMISKMKNYQYNHYFIDPYGYKDIHIPELALLSSSPGHEVIVIICIHFNSFFKFL